MEILEKLVLLPSLQQLALRDYLILLMLFFFLPFSGGVLVTSALSLFLGFRYPRPARDWVALLPGGIGAWILFGIVPPAALIFLYSQDLYGSGAMLGLSW